MSATHDTVDGAGRRHRVVVIGSGFGGLTATKALKNAPVGVTMIARTQHHLFQPLLYQVPTGIVSEGEIASPEANGRQWQSARPASTWSTTSPIHFQSR